MPGNNKRNKPRKKNIKENKCPLFGTQDMAGSIHDPITKKAVEFLVKVKDSKTKPTISQINEYYKKLKEHPLHLEVFKNRLKEIFIKKELEWSFRNELKEIHIDLYPNKKNKKGKNK